jgi:hypothetical protein
MLHQSSCANFVSNPYSEIYRRFIVVLVFYFFSQLEKALREFLELAKLMKEKVNIFKDFQGLIACNHSNVHLKWKTGSLDFNTPSG